MSDNKDVVLRYGADRLAPITRSEAIKILSDVIWYQEDAVYELAQQVVHCSQPQLDRKPRVLLLSGPPAVGKTSGARFIADMLNSSDGRIPQFYLDHPTAPRNYFLEIRSHELATNSQIQVPELIKKFFRQLSHFPPDVRHFKCGDYIAEVDRYFASDDAPEILLPRRKAVILLDECDKLPSLWRVLMTFFLEGTITVTGRAMPLPFGWDLVVALTTNVGQDIDCGSNYSASIQEVKRVFQETVLSRGAKNQSYQGSSHASRVLNHVIHFRRLRQHELKPFVQKYIARSLDQWMRQFNVSIVTHDSFVVFCIEMISSNGSLPDTRGIDAAVEKAVRTKWRQEFLQTNTVVCFQAFFDPLRLEAFIWSSPAGFINKRASLDLNALFIQVVRKICIDEPNRLGLRFICSPAVINDLMPWLTEVRFDILMKPFLEAVQQSLRLLEAPQTLPKQLPGLPVEDAMVIDSPRIPTAGDPWTSPAIAPLYWLDFVSDDDHTLCLESNPRNTLWVYGAASNCLRLSGGAFASAREYVAEEMKTAKQLYAAYPAAWNPTRDEVDSDWIDYLAECDDAFIREYQELQLEAAAIVPADGSEPMSIDVDPTNLSFSAASSSSSSSGARTIFIDGPVGQYQYLPLSQRVLQAVFPSFNVTDQMFKRLKDHLTYLNKKRKMPPPARYSLPRDPIYQQHRSLDAGLQRSHPQCYEKSFLLDVLRYLSNS